MRRKNSLSKQRGIRFKVDQFFYTEKIKETELRNKFISRFEKEFLLWPSKVQICPVLQIHWSKPSILRAEFVRYLLGSSHYRNSKGGGVPRLHFPESLLPTTPVMHQWAGL